jgi:hypothetical protein
LNIEQIKNHPFFYGVEWDTIRLIDAPFVPHLRSITDTSYFPTDEIDQAPAEAPVADAADAQKDLAFLGYDVYSALSCCRLLMLRHRQIYLQAFHDLIARCLMLDYLLMVV